MLPHVDAGDVQFIGQFSPKELEANDRKTLFLGSDNKLFYPNADMTIGAFRCYFKLPFLTAGDPKSPVREFVIDLGDGEVTGIAELDNRQLTAGDGAWYDLNGRKMANGKLPKGIYIHDGRKVIIK